MRRSLLRFGCASALVCGTGALLPAAAAGQTPAAPEDARLVAPYLAWDRGDYPEALRGYLEALRGPGGEALVREVARLTGEVYAVTELAPDGRNLTLSPDGLRLTYEVVDGGEAVTRVVDLTDGASSITLPGGDAVPGPSGLVAYLHVGDTPEVREAIAAAERVRASGDRASFFQAQRAVGLARARATTVRLHQPGSGADFEVDLEGSAPLALGWAPDAPELWIGAAKLEDGSGELLHVSGGRLVSRTPLEGGVPSAVFALHGASGAVVALAGGGVASVDGGGNEVGSFAEASSPSLAADGSVLAFLVEGDGETQLRAVSMNGAVPGEPRTLLRSERPLAAPSVSPAGARVAYQDRVVHDWEVFVVAADGGSEPVQVTWEIQHDLNPRWLDASTLLAAKGEGRHRRSYLYSLDGGDPLELFHNNTVRTIAPEYEWAVARDGSKVAIVSERDGDTVSPERGVYLVDLTTPVTRAQVEERLEGMLAAELDLRERGERAFEGMGAVVLTVTESVDVGRIYLAARDVFDMGSKHITQPGNALAIEYYAERLREYGYEPVLQWFEPRPGIRTANVIARLEGTVDPELVYVVSSHFDSTQRGPGADDDSSGATALLEAARVLKDHPMSATIEFAFFTGEEAGLLGSREYVRLAVEGGKRIVGALNNDMVGWANDHRLDNTIRYSNPGIRDIQHQAAILFTDLITYDALYYKSTDAAAYYEAYGDIVGGIGSYPVLGNPHYHQFTDRLETINQQLVAEVSKTTVATLMLLASSPSRLTGLAVAWMGEGVELSWDAPAESGITGYVAMVLGPDGELHSVPVLATGSDGEVVVGPEGRRSAHLADVPDGSEIRLLAMRGERVGWDWARAWAGGH